MNAALIMLATFALVFIYRGITQIESVQRLFHEWLGHYALCLQFYAVVLTITGALLVTSFAYVIAALDGVHFLEDASVTRQLTDVLVRFNVKPTDRSTWIQELSIGPQLRTLVLYSLPAILLTFFFASAHVVSFVLQNRHLRNYEYFELRRERFILQVIMLPAIYGTLALRCVLRALVVMTADLNWDNPLSPSTDWTSFIKFNVDQYNSNFAVADFAEMCAMVAFTKLCVSLLKEAFSTNALYQAFSAMTMQGMHAFILVGLLRSAFALLRQEGGLYRRIYGHDLDPHGVIVAGESLERWAGIVEILFTFTSTLALYNMVTICWLPRMQHFNPKIKFMGTRAIIVFAQFQPTILHAAGAYCFDWSQYQIHLIHATLMCYECCIVSIVHLFTWPQEDFDDGILPLIEPDAVYDKLSGSDLLLENYPPAN